MAGAVVFLVGTGLLVLADQVALVVLHMDAADHADLLPAVHRLPVEVERRLLVPKQSALEDELIQRLPRPQVDPRVVGVHLLAGDRCPTGRRGGSCAGCPGPARPPRRGSPRRREPPRPGRRLRAGGAAPGRGGDAWGHYPRWLGGWGARWRVGRWAVRGDPPGAGPHAWRALRPLAPVRLAPTLLPASPIARTIPAPRPPAARAARRARRRTGSSGCRTARARRRSGRPGRRRR